jgi:hypothetical protein
MTHHAPIVAAHKGKGYTDRQYAAAILDVLSGEMTAAEIARATDQIGAAV